MWLLDEHADVADDDGDDDGDDDDEHVDDERMCIHACVSDRACVPMFMRVCVFVCATKHNNQQTQPPGHNHITKSQTQLEQLYNHTTSASNLTYIIRGIRNQTFSTEASKTSVNKGSNISTTNTENLNETED